MSGTYVSVVLVAVLGALRVDTATGRHVEVCRRMERRLLTALAAHQGGTVGVDVLIDALWGEAAPPSARKGLQMTVLRLRQVLGADAIVTEQPGYRLGPGVDVDVCLFERDRDLSWWRGEPFGELAGWVPLEGRRAELLELRARAEETGVEVMLADGLAAEAVAVLERLVVEDGVREVRWTLLVRALVAADRRPDALRAFDRARRTLAVELGIAPGVELAAAHDAALRGDISATGGDDPVVATDELLRVAAIQASAGDVRGATRIFVDAADMARRCRDVRRFAEAALGAAGDGTRLALDAIAEVTTLVREALERLPGGPTRTRARLLARLSVLQNHTSPPSINEALAASALDLANALDEPDILAVTLSAIVGAVADPRRHEERQEWIQQLRALADAHPDEPWRRWVLPHEAREDVLGGDIATALERFGELAADATAADDVVALHAANFRGLLAATTVGDWDAARAAASRARTSAVAALLDDATATLMEGGMLRAIDMLTSCEPLPAMPHIEWPTIELNAFSEADRSLAHARSGQSEHAAATLDRLVTTLPHVERDAYWLATLSMAAEAAHRCKHRAAADLVSELLTPCDGWTITDPGLIYRGAAAHFAGLAAAVLQRPEATDLLHTGLQIHQRHGARWMAERSRAALAT